MTNTPIFLRLYSILSRTNHNFNNYTICINTFYQFLLSSMHEFLYKTIYIKTVLLNKIILRSFATSNNHTQSSIFKKNTSVYARLIKLL